MKDAYYFPHDSNARHDPKLMALTSEYGLLGYSYFFILIEVLREQEGYRLNKRMASALAIEWQVPIDRVLSILADLQKLDLISMSDDGMIFSVSLDNRMAEFDRKKKIRSDAGKIGAAKLWQTHSKRIAKDSKESRVEKSRVEKSKVLTPITSTLFEDPELKELWEAWMEVRTKKHVPNTDRALRLALAKLESWGSVKAKDALRNAVEKGWRGIFEPPANVVQAAPSRLSERDQKILNEMNESARRQRRGY